MLFFSRCTTPLTVNAVAKTKPMDAEIACGINVENSGKRKVADAFANQKNFVNAQPDLSTMAQTLASNGFLKDSYLKLLFSSLALITTLAHNLASFSAQRNFVQFCRLELFDHMICSIIP